jgi:hypothetical protein
MPTIVTPTVQSTTTKVLTAFNNALDILLATMADAANRPKEALQAAKLVLQKVNLKLWLTLSGPSNGKPTKSGYIPQPPTDAELLEELASLDKQLVRLLGSGDGGSKGGKKKPPQWDPFSKLPNPHTNSSL